MALVCVSDYAKKAAEILPKSPWDYYASGAGDQITLKLNESAFNRWIDYCFLKRIFFILFYIYFLLYLFRSVFNTFCLRECKIFSINNKPFLRRVIFTLSKKWKLISISAGFVFVHGFWLTYHVVTQNAMSLDSILIFPLPSVINIDDLFLFQIEN